MDKQTELDQPTGASQSRSSELLGSGVNTTTPWQDYVKDSANNPYADFEAFERWLREKDEDDLLADIDHLAMTFIYAKFFEAMAFEINNATKIVKKEVENYKFKTGLY